MTKRHTGHTKRIAAPKRYNVLRQAHKYITKMSPGAHKQNESMPLLLILRDLLKKVSTSKEAKRILLSNQVLIDNAYRKNPKMPIGLMDVISFPATKENYRVLFGTDDNIKLIKVKDNEAKIKLCKVLNKSKISGGKTQLNLHDGRNILVEAGKYKTGDSLLITLPDQKIQKQIPMEKGVKVYISDGKHIGEMAVLADFKPQAGSRADRVLLTGSNGENFETLEKYIFVIGKEKSEIELSGE